MATVRIEYSLSHDGIYKNTIWVYNDPNIYYSHKFMKQYGQSHVQQLNRTLRLTESEIQQLEMGKCPVCPE